MSPRPRERVLANLESIYREAYERAKAAGDQARMADLDAAYQREQLLLEVLLDVRDALAARPADVAAGPEKSSGADAVAALESIHSITKLRCEKRKSLCRGVGLLCLWRTACCKRANNVRTWERHST